VTNDMCPCICSVPRHMQSRIMSKSDRATTPIDYLGIQSCEFYDELPLWSAPFGLLLLDRVPLRRGMFVVDVGSGTGFLSVELAQRCGEETRVVAVDPWRPAAERLRRKLDALGLDNVQVLEADAAALDLPANSVDLVVSNLGINNFEHPETVLHTCVRIMKPGAMLALTTNLSGHMEELYRVYRDTLYEIGQPDRLSALEDQVQRRGTIDSVSCLLSGVGLEVTETLTSTFRMRFADGSSMFRHAFVRLAFTPGLKAIARPGDEDQTMTALERNLDALAAREGELALTVPMACFVGVKRGGRGTDALHAE
jgi:arsenite methyltransferase